MCAKVFLAPFSRIPRRRVIAIQVAEQLSVYQQTLRDKTRSMKAMASEMNMHQAQVNEYKFEVSLHSLCIWAADVLVMFPLAFSLTNSLVCANKPCRWRD